jgi:hypothetical protein
MRRYHFAGRFSQVRHADAGRKGGVRLCQPLDGHPQPPLILRHCQIAVLSQGYHRIIVPCLSLTSTHSPFAWQIPYLFAHLPMSRRLRAGSSILFGHVLFDLSCSCPLGRASLRILLYSGIPYSCVIYLCAKYFLPGRLLQLVAGYLLVDNSGGAYTRAGRYLSPLGPRSGPPFIIALLVFSQVYNRVISEWSFGLFISISGSIYQLQRSSSSVLTARQRFNIFLVHPITSNVLTLIQSTARSDINDSILAR